MACKIKLNAMKCEVKWLGKKPSPMILGYWIGRLTISDRGDDFKGPMCKLQLVQMPSPDECGNEDAGVGAALAKF